VECFRFAPPFLAIVEIASDVRVSMVTPYTLTMDVTSIILTVKRGFNSKSPSVHEEASALQNTGTKSYQGCMVKISSAPPTLEEPPFDPFE